MKNKILQMLLFATIVCSSTLYNSPVLGKDCHIKTGVAVQEETTNLTAGVTNILLKIINEPIIEEYYDGWTISNLNIRKEPSLESEILEVCSFNTLVKYSKYNEEWAKIKYNSKTAYISLDYISNKKLNYKDYTVPLTSGFKSYMPYTAITSKSSPQYKLQQQCQTGLYGIRVKDGRYCVAIGTGFNADVGTYFDLILANGTVIPCIVADIKSDKHTDSSHMVTKESGCLTEFVVDSGSLNRMVNKMGDISYCSDKWNSRVEKVRVYEKNIFKEVN